MRWEPFEKELTAKNSELKDYPLLVDLKANAITNILFLQKKNPNN